MKSIYDSDTVREALLHDSTISLVHIKRTCLDVLALFQGDLQKVAEQAILPPGVQEIDRSLFSKVQQHADIFLAVVAEGIDFVEADHLRKRLSGKTDMIIKQIGGSSRRDMISAGNGRKRLIVILQILKHLLDCKCRDTHTSEGKRILFGISTMTYRAEISSCPVKQSVRKYR